MCAARAVAEAREAERDARFKALRDSLATRDASPATSLTYSPPSQNGLGGSSVVTS